MNRLAHIIGPAPDELIPMDYLQILRGERTRVAKALEDFKRNPPKQGKTRKPKETIAGPKLSKEEKAFAQLAQAMAKEMGVEPEEFLKLLKEGKVEVSGHGN